MIKTKKSLTIIMKTQDNIDQVSDSNESNTEKNNTNENRGDLQGTQCTFQSRVAKNKN